jgi:hypothetical protein
LRLCNIKASPSLKTLKSKLISVLVSFISSLYVLLTSGALSPFVCTKNLDGSWSLTRSPDIQCYADEWMKMFPLVALFLLLYVLVFPLTVIGILFANRTNLQNQDFLQKFGHLVRDYRLSFCYWEVVVMLKRVCTSAFVQFVSYRYDSYGTCFFAICAFFLFIMLDTFCFPYNRLENMTQSVMWSILLSVSILSNSLVFNNSAVPSETKELVEIMLVSLISLSILWFIFHILKVIFTTIQPWWNNPFLGPAYIDHYQLELNTPLALALDATSLDQIIVFPQSQFGRCKDKKAQNKKHMNLVLSNEMDELAVRTTVHSHGMEEKNNQVYHVETSLLE